MDMVNQTLEPLVEIIGIQDQIMEVIMEEILVQEDLILKVQKEVLVGWNPTTIIGI